MHEFKTELGVHRIQNYAHILTELYSHLKLN